MERIPITTPELDNIIADYAHALEERARIRYQAENGPVIVDFQSVDWIGPAQLTTLACTINQLRDEGYQIGIEYPVNTKTKSWFEQIDFPEGSSNPDQQQNHLPICQIPRRTGHSALDVVGSRIRELLKRQIEIPVNAVFYPISEIINNVEEHSQCEHGYLMVQNYPSKACLDLCVIDDGISIPANYEEHNIPFEDDVDAVRKALYEGVSTKGAGRGYGLRTTSNLVTEGLNGDVVLSSRNGFVARHQTNELNPRFQWDGTVFIARMYPPPDDFDYTDYIE